MKIKMFLFVPVLFTLNCGGEVAIAEPLDNSELLDATTPDTIEAVNNAPVESPDVSINVPTPLQPIDLPFICTDKIEICHKSVYIHIDCNKHNRTHKYIKRTITISCHALAAHLARGDSLGPCENN